MPLTKKQIDKIDQLIENNRKRPDIVNEVVGKMHADVREVDKYLQENKTLQSMLNVITRKTKAITIAGSETERKTIAKETEGLAKKVIRLLQRRAGQ